MTITVAVVYGGRSHEHSVSCVSACNVVHHLHPEKYSVIPVGITPEGRWVATDVDSMVGNFDNGLPVVENTNTPVRLVHTSQAAWFPGDPHIVPVDVVIPMLHGRFGEDGTIQGMLEIADIPYVGAKVLASAVSMDKSYTKSILHSAGISVGKVAAWDSELEAVTPTNFFEQLVKEKTFSPDDTLYVKPSRAGSSVGVRRAQGKTEIIEAIEYALQFDTKIMLEQEIVGREIEVAVLEHPDGTITASTPSEIIMPDHSTYDFDSKYKDNTAVIELPAQLTPEHCSEIQKLAVKAFKALDCRGLSRVDFFLTQEGPIINEVNTMPGFTPTSQYPSMIAYDGISYEKLLDILINTALKKTD